MAFTEVATGWASESSRTRSRGIEKVSLLLLGNIRRLNELEERLDLAEFLRVHRSAIVRLDQILEVVPVGSGRYRLALKGGGSPTVSRGRAQVLKRLIL